MRLRFTIRDLLWLTAFIAMGVAWWLDRSRLAAKYDDLERSIQPISIQIGLARNAAFVADIFWGTTTAHNQIGGIFEN